MSSTARIVNIKVSTHGHPTEDLALIEAAVRTVMGMEQGGGGEEAQGKITVTQVDGDYGNKIHVLMAMATSKREIKHVLEAIAAKLDPRHKAYLSTHFESFTSDRRLIMRFNKQMATSGNLLLSPEDDIIHVAIKVAIHRNVDEGGTIDAMKNVLTQASILT